VLPPLSFTREAGRKPQDARDGDGGGAGGSTTRLLPFWDRREKAGLVLSAGVLSRQVGLVAAFPKGVGGRRVGLENGRGARVLDFWIKREKPTVIRCFEAKGIFGGPVGVRQSSLGVWARFLPAGNIGKEGHKQGHGMGIVGGMFLGISVRKGGFVGTQG